MNLPYLRRHIVHLERNKLQLEWTWQQHVPERNILCIIIIIFLCNKILRHKKNSKDKGICLQMKLTIIMIIITVEVHV